MKHIFSFLALLVLTFGTSIAQDFEHYSPILSNGRLPAEVINSSSSKFESEEKEGKKQKDENKFLLSSRFEVDLLIRSRLIVHDTAITNYFYKIANALLKDKPDLRAKLKFYLLKSPAVNAFAYHDGSIFICMGTLAHLENEAQLAYILSHEIVHVEKSHSLNRYLEFKKMGKNKKRQRSQETYSVDKNKSIDVNTLRKCRFSQDQESTADENGLKQLLKSNYDFTACKDIYTHLKYSYLPYDSIPFEPGIFWVNNIDFPKDFMLEELNPMEGVNENDNDSTHSHPNIAKRKTATLNAIKGLDNKGKELFVVSENKFNEMQTIARFELPHLFNHEQFYEEAIYHAYLLYFRYPENPYLEKCIAQSLYGIAKAGAGGGFRDFEGDIEVDSLEGEVQQVYHFFSKASKKQKAVLALNYLWKMKEKYPKDEEIAQMWKECGKEMPYYFNLAAADFSTTPPIKVDRKKLKDWEKYVFADYLDNKDFKSIFDKPKEEETSSPKSKKTKTVVPFKDYSDLSHKPEKAVKLGVDKVVIVNPFFMKLDLRRKGEGKLLLETEAGRKNLVAALKENARLCGIEAEVLHISDMEDKDVEKFNDMNLLEEWVDEQIEVGDNSFTGTQQEKINELAKKYNTDYFLWVGTIDISARKNHWMNYMIWSYSIMLPPTWPEAWYYICKKEYQTVVYAVLYNVKTGKNQVIKKNSFSKKARESVIAMQLYDMFLQIHKK